MEGIIRDISPLQDDLKTILERELSILKTIPTGQQRE